MDGMGRMRNGRMDFRRFCRIFGLSSFIGCEDVRTQSTSGEYQCVALSVSCLSPVMHICERGKEVLQKERNEILQ